MGEDRGGREGGRRQRSKSDVTGCSTYKGGRPFVLKWEVFFGSFFWKFFLWEFFYSAKKGDYLYCIQNLMSHVVRTKGGSFCTQKASLVCRVPISHVTRIQDLSIFIQYPLIFGRACN